MNTLQYQVGQLLASKGFEDGWTYIDEVRSLLKRLVVVGLLADDEVDWTTPESREAALEAWNRRAA